MSIFLAASPNMRNSHYLRAISSIPAKLLVYKAGTQLTLELAV
jgi:hypothetical protein